MLPPLHLLRSDTEQLDRARGKWLGSEVSSHFRPLVLSAGVLFACLGSAAAAPRPRDEARALIAEIDKTPAARGAARDALSEARRSLERAERARLAGDHHHGAKLEDLALEWAKAAKDLSRAAEAATRASELEKKQRETEAKLERAHTLVEQTHARRARAEAQLKELEAAQAAPPAASALPQKPKAQAPKSATPASTGSAGAAPPKTPAPAPSVKRPSP
jgi:hypothetical protein